MEGKPEEEEEKWGGERWSGGRLGRVFTQRSNSFARGDVVCRLVLLFAHGPGDMGFKVYADVDQKSPAESLKNSLT